MVSIITVNGQPVNLVALPSSPGLRSVDFDFIDAVAVVTSPFTGQTQALQWPGADRWTGTMTLPSLDQEQADAWISALMQMRGMANAIQLGDPLKTAPRGNPLGTPVCPLVPVDAAGSQVLHTQGWTPGKFGLLLPGDYLQVGYRLLRNLDFVNADSTGAAVLNVWPSLREVPAPSAPVILNSPKGLFRRANNKGTWSADYTRLSRMSFQVMEYR